MGLKNIIKKDNKFGKEYLGIVVSNEDPLKRGRVQVKVDAILGDIPFWVNASLVAGSTRLLLVPEPNDNVKITFKNNDIYSGEWSLDSNPNNASNIDPNKYGMMDTHGNAIIVDKKEKTLDEVILDGKISIIVNKSKNDETKVKTIIDLDKSGKINIIANDDDEKPKAKIDLDSEGVIHITAQNASGTPNSKITLNANGTIVIDATSAITVNAPTTTFSQNVAITGTLTVASTCTFEGIKWKTHVHPYTHGGTAAGGDDTGAPKNQ